MTLAATHPKLSVIVPAYRLAPYIHECLLSVLAQQTNFDFEVIVCDDASPDQTLAVIRTLEVFPQLRILHNPQNLGLVGTMRRLLQAARGQYIAYLDGDDVALPGKLQAQVDHLDQHPSCALVYHESDIFDSQSGQSIRRYTADYYNAAYIKPQATLADLVRYGTFLQASSIMFRRHAQLLDALAHGCQIICDFPWHLRNVGYLQGSIDGLPQVLGRYRVHSQSFGAQTARDMQRRLTVTAELVSACQQMATFGLDPDIIQAGVNHSYWAAALYFLQRDQAELAQQMLQQPTMDSCIVDPRQPAYVALSHDATQLLQYHRTIHHTTAAAPPAHVATNAVMSPLL